MKRKLSLLLILLLASSITSFGQKFYWAHSAESNSNSNDIRAIEITSDGHTIAFGTFNYILHVGDFVLEETDTGTSYFLARFDENGDVVWVRKIQCDEYFTVTTNQIGLTIDASDNIYITSKYEGNIQFEDVTVSNTEATVDYFVAKYKSSGELVYAWGQGADDAIAVDIAVDDNSHIYVAGHFAGTMRFNDPDETELTSSGSHDAFIAKYDDEGTAVWSRKAGNADNYDFSYGVEISGDYLYWGYNYRVGVSVNTYHIAIAKLTLNNDLEWTFQANSTDSGNGFLNQANQLKAYGSDIYLVGHFRGGIQPDGEDTPLPSSDYQSLTIKIKDSGSTPTYQWSVQMGGTSFDYGYSVAHQGSSVYVGRYSSPDAYIDEFADSDGSLIRSTTSSSLGTNDRDYIYDIEVTSENQLRFGGYFDENISYGENGNWTSESPNLFLCQSDLLVNPDWLVGSYSFEFFYEKSLMDNSGNTYVGGTFSGVLKEGEEIIKSHGSRDILVEKYDPAGNLVFRKLSGTVLNDYFGDIALQDNELYLTGVYDVHDGSVSLQIEDEVITGDENQEIFLAKYSDSGDLIFATQAASSKEDLGVNGIGLDKNGNLYLYGDAQAASEKNFGNDVLLSDLDKGFFLTKYNSLGVAQWARSVNETDDYEMHVSPEKGIFISGKYAFDDIDFEGTILPSHGWEDFFIAKYDYDGSFQWVVDGGGSSSDAIGGITVDSTDGSVYATGYFYSSMTLSDITVSGTNRELFVVKYDNLGEVEWLVSGGGNRVRDQGKAIALDTAGNVVIVGQYEGDDATFDDYTPGGAGEYEVDALLLVYDSGNGDLIEGHHWGVPTNYLEGDDNEYFKGISINENNDLSVVGQFVDEVMLDTINVPIYTYYSSFVTKMSLSDCAYVGSVDFEFGGDLNADEPVSFTDLTNIGAHTINEWRWNFGDGFQSDEQHPEHVYSDQGEYEVTLSITYNSTCQLELTKSIAIDKKLNSPPIVIQPINDNKLIAESSVLEINLNDHFSDPDDEELLFEPISNDDGIATVSVSGTILKIAPGSKIGISTITVTGTDGVGATVQDQFLIEILPVPNQNPEVANPLTDMILNEGFGSLEIELSGVFEDKDEDVLEYSSSTSNENIVQVFIVDNKLIINEIDAGKTIITVDTKDGNGGTAMDQFEVTVNEKVLGINSDTEQKLVIYPSPTSGLITLNANKDQLLAVEIYNQLGGLVVSYMKTKTIDLKDLQSGTYLIRIVTPTKTYTSVVIKR